MILNSRKGSRLSQDEPAKKLFVTRQAMPRREDGETIPNTDTLRLIAGMFHMLAGHLLGRLAGSYQSCGMISEKDSGKGTGLDGSKSEEYCTFCFRYGKFAEDISMEELVEHNLQRLDERNESAGLHLIGQEARMQLMEFPPTLKRRKINSK